MVLAIAALLLHIPAVPQGTLNAVATIAPADAAVAAANPSAEQPAPDAAPDAASSVAPVDSPANAASVQLEEPQPSSNVQAFLMAGSPSPRFTPGSISVTALQQEYRPKERRMFREWMALSAAEHGAATFDAWSTRRAISSGQAHELDPLLRPFAGNASLYAAVQVAPVLLDYLGRRMMTNQHEWVRRTWWVPQAVSTAMSFASGIHNLGVHGAPVAP